MGIRDASGKEKIVILFNALVRFAQIVVAAAALGIYGTQKGYWLDHGLPAKIVSASLTFSYDRKADNDRADL